MSNSTDAGLFPLPLAPFEHYMLTDDRADYPATFFFRLRFSGRCDRSALEAAAAAAMARHPLLRALVHPTGNERFEWAPVGSPQLPISWHCDALPVFTPEEMHIDLQSQIGWRVFVVEQDDRTEMLLQFHHACCDGLGAMQFVEDLLAAYHDSVSPQCARPPSRPLDPLRLRQRGRFEMTPLKYLLRMHKEAAGLLGSLEFHAHRPAPLAAAQLPAAGPPAFPSICAHTFSAADTAGLRQAAAKMRGTVNDLLLRNMFSATSAWNARIDPPLQKRILRVMIPTNLRTNGDAAMPAANVVSMVFIDRRAHNAASEKMTKLASLELKYCKNWRLGLTMIHYMQAYRMFPGGLKKLLPTDRCLATTVLSNMGDSTRDMALLRRDGRIIAGNMTLEAIEIVPPIRPLTHATFCVLFYAGQLTAAVQYDARRFTREEGSALLRSFVERVEESVRSV
jgi:hypothetical protein